MDIFRLVIRSTYGDFFVKEFVENRQKAQTLVTPFSTTLKLLRMTIQTNNRLTCCATAARSENICVYRKKEKVHEEIGLSPR
jgi:hypothetical protein